MLRCRSNLSSTLAIFGLRLAATAEQLDVLQSWYRILSEALRYYRADGSSNRRSNSTRPELPPPVVARPSVRPLAPSHCRI